MMYLRRNCCLPLSGLSMCGKGSNLTTGTAATTTASSTLSNRSSKKHHEDRRANAEIINADIIPKLVAPTRLRPPDVPQFSFSPSVITDVYVDMDGTLTESSSRAGEYILPLLSPFSGVLVTDCVYSDLSRTDIMSWSQLDDAMSRKLPEAILNVSDNSIFGTWSAREDVQDSLRTLVRCGLRVHILTMGTAKTCKAVLRAAGYDMRLFTDFLGPSDMARNQGLDYLFEHEQDQPYMFPVEQDVKDLEAYAATGESSPLLDKIMTMEKRLSKAQLVQTRAGDGGILIDDSWSKNIYDARKKNCMYMHVQPEGLNTTAHLLSTLARAVADAHEDKS
mmetsp:Transcript_29885/g.64664  ORF Transcript_29885/g.64664 Transcript_29885/m.64664 type:complete len:335 (-) Transcript_29885:65-1069(-)